YTADFIGPADMFSAAASGAVSDSRLRGTVAAVAALLQVENDQSVQRAILYGALSAHPPVLSPRGLSSLQQAAGQEASDLAAFRAAGPAEQELFAYTVAGPAVDEAAAQESLAEAAATARPSKLLTANTGLDATAWYRDMSITIGDTRRVTGRLAGQVTGQADTLKSNAAKSLLLTSIALVLLLVLLTTAVL